MRARPALAGCGRAACVQATLLIGLAARQSFEERRPVKISWGDANAPSKASAR